MQLKINKRTIETILWLLGQLITLLRAISKENKDNKYGEVFNQSAECYSNARLGMLNLKKKIKEEDHEKKEDKRKAKGN